MKQVAEKQGSVSPETAFIKIASHDIQGTFFGVYSICTLLKDSVENMGDTDLLLDHLMGACQLYKGKLSNFLEYTRFGAGIHNTVLESVNIRRILNRVVYESRLASPESTSAISLSISDDMPEEIPGDELRIIQICSNLLNNAICFSGPGSPVFLQACMEDRDNWTITVEDRGTGMTEGELESVFKLLPAERTALKNPVGLGLIVTRFLVEEVLEGTIILVSQPGVGTSCKVILPLKDPESNPENVPIN